jgi:anti-sigma regulatory factor (Ser/Thr protein kinase)/putative methionine-R-sulfoxide reductase with GAF domain
MCDVGEESGNGMDLEGKRPEFTRPPRGTGQTVLSASATDLPKTQIETLYGLGDPGLSELGLEEFLDELLERVREALGVDTVAILLLDNDTGQLVARAAKGIEEEVEQGVRIPIGVGFAGRIANERVGIFVADVDHADVLNPILREKGIRSLLGAPLIVEGELIGVIHVGSLKPRTFTPRDLAVLDFAAARAAPGIERARLVSALEREHRVALGLQRSLLPRRLIDVVGVAVAARYLPASDEVGGDWYDVFELPKGEVGIVIGDVVGHGVRAAALMGQLRTALHAYAMSESSPARTLERLDRFVQGMGDFAMATSAYAVFNPETGGLRIASAGHLPAIILGDGQARLLEIAPAAPLGAFMYGSIRDHELTLAEGETLLFYTDGLIERPGVPLTESIADLRDLLAVARSGEDACDLAFDRLVPAHGLRDDVAIVTLENLMIPSTLELTVRANPHVLTDVRRSMRRWLHRNGLDEQTSSEVTLAVSEACANAIEHAYSPAPAEFTLNVRKQDGTLIATVCDTGRWRPPRGEHRGRGLAIIDTVMDEVDVRSSDVGTEIVMQKRVA